jgi:hypothetical protein
MSRLDDELRRAFRRREPSDDFAERVVARIALQQVAPEPEKTSWWAPLFAYLNPFAMRRGQMRLALAGAIVCLVVATIGVHRYRERQREQVQGEAARAQVIFALQIASAKLNAAQKKVQSLSDDPGDRRQERTN